MAILSKAIYRFNEIPDLNQIPYDSTVEVRNRFKGLDLIDRVPDELWMEVHDTVQETGIKIIPPKKEMQKSKMAAWGGLTNSCEKKRNEKKKRKVPGSSPG